MRLAADTLPFDSIMVDFSHYEKAESLAKTAELVAYCHERGIATEAEPGRIEGGEDGVADTVDMEGILTTPEEVEEFIATGVDFLAPAVGNVHGEYGRKGPQLDFARYVLNRAVVAAWRVFWKQRFDQDYRLERINKQARGRVRLVLHGTNGFPDELTQRCISMGISKINVNRLVLDDYNTHLHENASKLPQTQLIEQGTREVVSMQEHQMKVCGSAGRA